MQSRPKMCPHGSFTGDSGNLSASSRFAVWYVRVQMKQARLSVSMSCIRMGYNPPPARNSSRVRNLDMSFSCFKTRILRLSVSLVPPEAYQKYFWVGLENVAKYGQSVKTQTYTYRRLYNALRYRENKKTLSKSA